MLIAAGSNVLKNGYNSTNDVLCPLAFSVNVKQQYVLRR